MAVMLKNRQIIHVDMDAFFASVEVLDCPKLEGEAVIVGGSSNRGVVSAASYKAREYGVHSAMPIVQAKRLCPQGVFMRPRMWRYQEISQQVMAIFKHYTPLVEPISLDEAFLDVSESRQLFGEAHFLAKDIKKRIKTEIGITASAGVGSSKLIAKIASDRDKPDGLTIIRQGEERAFLAPLAISTLWGVGKKTAKELHLLGIRTIGDLTALPQKTLSNKFGKHGSHLYYAARAIDERPVTPERTIKSISNEETFSTDLIKLDDIRRHLLALAVKVGKRLRDHNLKTQTISIKTKYYDFQQTTKSLTIKTATNDSATLYKVAKELLSTTMAGKKPLRLIGLTTANLLDNKTPQQVGMFDDNQKNESTQNLNNAIDQINDRFGNNIVKPGTLI